MKKLLYIAPVILNHVKPNGVGKKIIGQVHSFSKSYNTSLVSYSDSGLLEFSDMQYSSIKHTSSFRRLAMYFYVFNKVIRDRIDYVYIRYHLADPVYVFLLFILRALGCKIAIEIPTYPYANSFDSRFVSYIKLWVDKLSFPFLRFCVGRIITYSSDEKIFGIPTVKTLNGIDFSKEKMVTKLFDEKLKTINLISVSMTYSCHGYDRIIKGLSTYYKKTRDIKVCFHIVGKGDEIPKLKALTTKLGMESYVVFDGFQTGEDLDALYANSDMAINSLGIHRIGLKTESTLKAKEYCAKGLPIVSSYLLDSLSSEDNSRYVCFVPADDSEVDIEKLVTFYLNLQKEPDYHYEIREKSSKICDMDKTLEKVRDFYNNGK